MAEDTFRTDPQGDQGGNCQGLFYVGDTPYPAKLDLADIRGANGDVLHRTRRARLLSETSLELSIVWGDATWSSNRLWLSGSPPFQEEPTHVRTPRPGITAAASEWPGRAPGS